MSKEKLMEYGKIALIAAVVVYASNNVGAIKKVIG